MCICINCEFSKTCWIKKGITKIPKNYIYTSLNLTLSNLTPFNINSRQSLSLKIILNNIISKQKYEFDVVQCQGFCERPGKWLNNNF
uniref:hypothetical protein ycf34 n=1 Tax=Chlorobotrys sp. TaxID=2859677 RepID=UPI00218248BE|nr:hypothetical protein ycf34 [Chlorobotrys sp.]UVI60810.1 hypothetical protein ycf34 [Chlorobotrys sp.]